MSPQSYVREWVLFQRPRTLVLDRETKRGASVSTSLRKYATMNALTFLQSPRHLLRPLIRFLVPQATRLRNDAPRHHLHLFVVSDTLRSLR